MSVSLDERVFCIVGAARFIIRMVRLHVARQRMQCEAFISNLTSINNVCPKSLVIGVKLRASKTYRLSFGS